MLALVSLDALMLFYMKIIDYTRELLGQNKIMLRQKILLSLH